MSIETLRPRFLSSAPIEPAVIPLPNDETTPPVMNTYLDILSAQVFNRVDGAAAVPDLEMKVRAC